MSKKEKKGLEKDKGSPHGIEKAAFHESIWGDHYGEYRGLHWLLVLWLVISATAFYLKIGGLLLF